MKYPDSPPERLKRLFGTKTSEIEYITEKEFQELMETRRKAHEAFEKYGKPAALKRREELIKQGIIPIEP